MKQIKAIIFNVLHQYTGNDFECTRSAFRKLSENELGTEYEQSGKTCRQILNEYKQHK